MNAGSVVFKFEGDTKDIESKTKKIGTSVGDIIKGSLASKAIAAGIGAINENLDDAISRFDQLNQFPKVMNSLGISTEDANEAMDMINDSILGLPTTLNQATSAVQRFAAKNGDVKLSSKYFTAVNDAILSGTNDTTLYNSALEQMMQAYSKGKPDMMEFRSWLTAMPGQMKQISQAMGFASSDELYQGFKDGTVTMEDFMNTLVKLDTEGSGNVAAFSKSVRESTEGVGTSITNMKTAIVRGISNSMTAIDNALKENNLPTISGIIQGITQGINNIFKFSTSALQKILPIVQPLIMQIINMVQKGWTSLQPIFAQLSPILMSILRNAVAFGSKILSIAASVFKALLPIISSILSFVTKHSTYFKTMALGVVTFIAAFKGISAIIGIISTLKSAISGVFAVLSANPVGLVIAGIAAVVVGIMYLWKHCEGFRNVITTIFTTIGQIGKTFFDTAALIIIGFANKIQEAFTFIKAVVSTVFQFIGDYISLRINFAKAVIQTAINAIVTVFGRLKNGVTAIINGVVSGFWGFVNFVASVPGKIVSFFASLPGNMLNIGKNLIVGLWNGIGNKVNWILGKIKGFGNAVLKKIKGIFGVHSPSTEFAWIGKMNMVGLEQGMEGMQPKVQSMIDGMFDLSPNVTGTASNYLSPSINVINNVSMETDPLGQMVKKVKTFSGGAKNDYNYGMGA